MDFEFKSLLTFTHSVHPLLSVSESMNTFLGTKLCLDNLEEKSRSHKTKPKTVRAMAAEKTREAAASAAVK